MSGVSVFDRTIQKANIWLKDVSFELDGIDKELSYTYLRAVLHALRDRITTAEVIDLAAQLPMILRGMFFDNWRPDDLHHKERTKEDFLLRVEENLGPHISTSDLDIERITRVVLAVLSQHISEGEMLDVLHSLPKPMRRLFPEWETNFEARL